MKEQQLNPDEKPVTGNTIITGCYELQKIIIDAVKEESRCLSANEMRIILDLSKAIKYLGKDDNGPDTNKVIIIGPKDRHF